jgi:uncharacterized protein YfaS (alpha-2-macroglobulin family)
MRNFVVAALLVLVSASVVLLTSLSLAQSLLQSTPSGPVAATYVHGVLHVSIPYSASRTGEGDLRVEVLDPEDRVVGSLDRHVFASAGHGFQEQNVAIHFENAGALPVDDLVWHRLRYRFTYKDDHAAALQGIISISRILRRPVVHVLGQQSYLSGGAAAVRLIVTEADNETPVTSGSLQVELLPPGQKPQTLYTGKLNERGTTRANFRFPTGLAGAFQLRYAVDTGLGQAESTQQIRLEEKASILLTTEKPVYQPGQTIHVRALALDRSNHQATGGRRLTFEVDDSRGNKVFRKITQTDAYGVASAEFGLADEVNLGTYHLRALMDEAAGAPQDKAEIALQVERYVLPKFKVDLDLAGNAAKAKRGYRPGDHVTGTVRSNYFFGKPVDHAEVVVKASARDVASFDAGESKGTTDADGAFRFDIRLPDFFAGHPLTQGAALVLIEATVKDNAGHSESHGEPITVSESPLLVTAIPEGGAIVPGLLNQMFILTSYPDGTPARADIQVHNPGFADQTVATDQGGIGIVTLPGTGKTMQLRIDAKDSEGNRASIPLQLEPRSGPDQILLRTDRALYRAGERIRLQVLSTRERGSAYIDVVKDAQTIATYDVDIVNGQANLDLSATPGMAGTVGFNAYLFGRDARPVGDHRLVFVQPADELRVETAVDSPVYKPGGEARIGFHVTNSRGEGVQAVLGLEVVDQAVFALAEKQPGFAKVFFYLEREMMKPRYEIHSIGLPETVSVSSTSPAEAGQRDRAARALFSATELTGVNNAALEFGRDVPQSKFPLYAARYQKRLNAQVGRLTDLLERADEEGKDTCSQAGAIARLANAKLVDPWGNPLRVDWYPRSIVVRSAGPDGMLYTSDDVVQGLEDPWCPSANTIRARIEHDRGPANGQAAVTGTVVDPAGGVVSGATIKIVETATGRSHTLKSGAGGRFGLASLTAGRYRIEALAPGFRTTIGGFSLDERDLAFLSVMLDIGAAADTVMVQAEASLLKTESGVLAFAGPAAPPPPLSAPVDRISASIGAQPAVKTDTHVRSWFPESLYVAPEIITDREGRASVTIPIADSITTWRMAMLASTKQGALGSGTSSLKVFQDFFTEMDLPVTLTEGDQVSIPVAIYNYSGSRGNVHLRLEQSDWFSLDGDSPVKSVSVESDRVGASQFAIAAKRIGKFKLTLRAEMDGQVKRADIVVREIEVVPNGREQSMVFNGRLDSAVRQAINFPSAAIPDASTVFVRLYPGPLSQVVEGMDSLLRMPGGCFEQTSSSTYPNVLALDYMKRTKKVTPEVSAKAEGYIANGYQRLLTFEVPAGGFSWFGSAPANKILTSYGLMEFSDMSKVHDVDPKIIERTQQWLARQQQANGSWNPDTSFINEGATNRFNSDMLRITAYVAWSLEVTGYQGPAVDNAKRFIEMHLGMSAKPDVYTLAVLANFAVDYAKDPAFTEKVMQLLLDAKTEQGDQVRWNAEETSMYATGASAAVETTGLAVQAILKRGSDSAVATKAMNYLVSKKDASRAWGTTQATIMALRALLLSADKAGGTAKGAVEVVLNGKVAGRLALTSENNDLLHQFVFKEVDARAANAVEIRFTGEGSVAYQVAGRYFTAWNEKPANEALSIDVHYDRTHLEQDQIATATATVRNNLTKAAGMVMVDLGIPPGFELLSEDLDAYREKSAGQKSGRLEKFSLTATQAILYFDSVAPNGKFALSFRLRAKYPIRAHTFASRVYEYYAPEVGSLAPPVQLEVRKR